MAPSDARHLAPILPSSTLEGGKGRTICVLFRSLKGLFCPFYCCLGLLVFVGWVVSRGPKLNLRLIIVVFLIFLLFGLLFGIVPCIL